MALAQAVLIYETAAVRVYRGHLRPSGTAVILKSLPAGVENATLRGRLKYEYEIICQLAKHGVPWVPRPVELHQEGGELGFVTQDSGGCSLRAAMPLSLPEVLHVAVRLCEALEGAHALGITHKDINPDNIVFNRQTGAVELIDFGIAARLAREAQPLDSPHAIEGTPAYFSPEQTGRMTRMLDYRSDFYSLGVTLYELLGGACPFVEQDLALLVHAHLAQQPRDLHAMAPQVPLVLSKMVMKLLEKAPEDRYQSARGLLHDLQQVSGATARGEPVGDFAIAADDNNASFWVPEKIYGRDSERAVVLNAYAQVAQGGRAMLMVAGASGIGKSALIDSLQGALMQRNGVYAAGKHEQLHRHLPLSALSMAIEQVVKRALQEPSHVLALWQRRAQEALGHVGQAMIDVIPALELLVGKQEPVPALGPQETENRLSFCLDRLLRALCVDQPLVLFLDDLQWADSSTLHFLKRWRNDNQGGAGLLLVGAYRSEEVGASHPLRLVLNDLMPHQVPTATITLGPMSQPHIAELLRDATRQDQVDSLAEVLLAKTAGNAFFVREYLRDLARNDAFHFDATQRCWMWDLDAIRSAGATTNVLEFMATRISALSHAAERQLLSTAALLGRRFDLQSLCQLAGLSNGDGLAALQPFLEAGFIAAQGHDWRYSALSGSNPTFVFVHDKVHEAAARLLTGEAAVRVHHAIGKRLLEQVRDDPAPATLFLAVDHLNHAQLLLSPQEQADLANLNQQAALEAQKASAYDIAASYWTQALKAWGTESHAQARAAKLQLAECAFRTGRGELADAQLKSILEDSRDDGERVQVYRIRARCYATMLRPHESAQASIAALQILGFEMPRKATPAHVVWALIRMQRQLKGRPVEGLGDAPAITDPQLLSILGTLHEMVAATFFNDSNLFAVVVLSMGRITLAHGNSRFSSYVFGTLVSVYALLGNHALANRYAKASRASLVRSGDVSAAAKLTVDVSLGYAGMHMRDAVKAYQQSAQQTLACGDLVSATNSLGMVLNTWLTASRDELVAELSSQSGIEAHLNQDFQNYRRYFVQVERCFRGVTRAPGSFSDDDFDEDEEARRAQAGELGQLAAAAFNMHRTTVCVVDRVFHKAVDFGLLAIRFGGLKLAGEHNAFCFNFMFSTALAQLAHESGRLPAAHARQLRRIARRMRKIAAEEPFVALGVSRFVDAQIAALGKDAASAGKLYEEATERLAKTGYHGFCAVAHECAARHFLRMGLTMAGHGHLRRASEYYTSWNLPAKLSSLHREFGDLSSGRAPSTQRRTTTQSLGENLDLPALMRAMQTLSSERSVDSLSQQIVKITQEVAGATHAVLLLPDAQGALAPQGGGADLPLELIRYVSRTSQAVIADDAAGTPQWSKDRYLQEKRPRSLLCAPLLQQGQLRGVIYLENTLAPRVFTLERAELVKMLAVQAAVALDNARLYEGLEQEVAARTEDLRKAHAHLLKAQREAAEINMAGGFAHEMLNALSPVKYVLTSADDSRSHGPMRVPESLRDLLAAAQPSTREEGQKFFDELEQILDLAARGATRGLHVTEQILRYAEVAKLLPGSDRVNVPQLIQAVARELAGDFQAAKIRYVTDIPADLTLLANPEHVTVIVRNLMLNARDALAARPGQTERVLQVHGQVFQGQLALSVEDSGVGMDEPTRRRVFEPFFSTKGVAGAGLGLGLSRKIAQLYGGDIQFSSTRGKGTTFTLSLPQHPSRDSH